MAVSEIDTAQPMQRRYADRGFCQAKKAKKESSYLAGLFIKVAIAVGVAVEAPRARSEHQLEVGTRRHDGLSFNIITFQCDIGRYLSTRWLVFIN